jgi:hypothetical protein
MKNHTIAGLYLMTLVVCLLLTACQAGSTPPPTAFPTDTLTPTLTFTPSTTITPTTTPTFTITPTDTPTFTPTLPYNAPGSYDIYKCVSFQPFLTSRQDGANIIINFCVQTVKVNVDLSMQVNVIWKYTYTYTWKGTPWKGPSIIKTGFTNTVLIDNLKNEYKPLDAGGAAIHADQIESGGAVAGWYRFDPAKPGATSFRLLDLDLQIAVENIVLLPKLGTDTPTYTATALQGTPYNEPGTYWIYKCVTHPPTAAMIGATYVKFCLNTVVVKPDRTMRFNAAWTVYLSAPRAVMKEASGNSIVLEDDLGNQYDATQIGGCAAQNTLLNGSSGAGTCSGWYQYEAAKPGATSFRLVDMNNHVSIEGIILVPKSG